LFLVVLNLPKRKSLQFFEEYKTEIYVSIGNQDVVGIRDVKKQLITLLKLKKLV